jgi:hypothetical protein
MVLDFVLILFIMVFTEKKIEISLMYLNYPRVLSDLKLDIKEIIIRILCVFVYIFLLLQMSIIWNDIIIYFFVCVVREIMVYVSGC